MILEVECDDVIDSVENEKKTVLRYFATGDPRSHS